MPRSPARSLSARAVVPLVLGGLAPACAFEESKPGPVEPGGSAVVEVAPLAGRWCPPGARVGSWWLDASGGSGELGVEGRALAVRWTFGAAVVGVERRLDGVLFERQRWTLDADGGLVERELTTPDALGEDDLALVRAHPLDDLQALGSESDDALVRTVGACDRLPSSYGHGYPVAEGWYAAGAREADATAAASAAGGVAWYGHGGDEAGAPFSTTRSLSIVVRYDEEERMVEERLDRGAVDGGPHDLLRERAFDEGGLVIDRIERWSPTPKEDVVRVMRFAAAGPNLVERTLSDTWEVALETRWIPAPSTQVYNDRYGGPDD